MTGCVSTLTRSDIRQVLLRDNHTSVTLTPQGNGDDPFCSRVVRPLRLATFHSLSFFPHPFFRRTHHAVYQHLQHDRNWCPRWRWRSLRCAPLPLSPQRPATASPPASETDSSVALPFNRLSAIDYDRYRSPFHGRQGRLDGSRNGAEQGEEGARQPVRNDWCSPRRWSRIDHDYQHGLRRTRTHHLDWLRRLLGDDDRRRARCVVVCFGRHFLDSPSC